MSNSLAVQTIERIERYKKKMKIFVMLCFSFFLIYSLIIVADLVLISYMTSKYLKELSRHYNLTTSYKIDYAFSYSDPRVKVPNLLISKNGTEINIENIVIHKNKFSNIFKIHWTDAVASEDGVVYTILNTGVDNLIYVKKFNKGYQVDGSLVNFSIEYQAQQIGEIKLNQFVFLREQMLNKVIDSFAVDGIAMFHYIDKIPIFFNSVTDKQIKFDINLNTSGAELNGDNKVIHYNINKFNLSLPATSIDVSGFLQRDGYKIQNSEIKVYIYGIVSFVDIMFNAMIQNNSDNPQYIKTIHKIASRTLIPKLQRNSGDADLRNLELKIYKNKDKELEINQIPINVLLSNILMEYAKN